MPMDRITLTCLSGGKFHSGACTLKKCAALSQIWASLLTQLKYVFMFSLSMVKV